MSIRCDFFLGVKRKRVDFALDRTNHGWMSEMNREEVDAKLATVEARVDARLANLETTVKTGFADVRTGFAEVRTGFAELRTEIERMRVEMHKEISNLIKWAVALSFAVVGTTVGLLHFISKTS